jgi:UDP-2,3-diacylglucosamine pyrophosphatase LpxH
MSARTIYVVSDLHLGGVYPATPAATDRGFRICTHVEALARFVDRLAEIPHSEARIELVINGDMVDFLAERHADPPCWRPFITDQTLAADKLTDIIERDRPFFDALRRFLERGRRLVILLGNHDIELSLPLVRQRLFALLGVEGRHDCRFLYDGEAYLAGDALIEHGNRYDSFNVVDNDSLRRVRSLLSRRQAIPDRYRFDPPAGSKMVAEVINPIKETYRFVDLLKPETGAVVPLLLALEPGYRKLLSKALKHSVQASQHRMQDDALPGFGGDIRSDQEPALDDFGSDISSGFEDMSPAPTAPDDPELRDALNSALGGEADAFLSELQPSGGGDDFGGAEIGSDISTAETLDRSFGLIKLLLGRNDRDVEKRLPPLLKAMRCLQDDDSFNTEVEHFQEYDRAARNLAKNGIRHVVFGHTHHPRKVSLEGGGYYLNSGTWADVLRFPKEIVTGSNQEALGKLREFVAQISAGDFSAWTMFRPTYVRLDLDEADRVVRADLCDYTESDPV